MPVQTTSAPPHHAEIVISQKRRAGLSADDRRIAMLNSAFQPFSASFWLQIVPAQADPRHSL
jgi:hypothetical protein